MLPGVTFSERPPAAAGLSSRADIAMFAGLVPVRGAATDPIDTPVGVDSFGAFAAHFAWDARPVRAGSAETVPTALGLAVRSFFAAGGVRAWIVRCGDPLPLVVDGDAVETGQRALAGPGGVAILPGLGGRVTPVDPADAASWRGAARVLGRDDVALLCLPDLADLCAGPRATLPEPPSALQVPEAFKPCAPVVPGAIAALRDAVPALAATRLDADGYRRWADAVAFLLALLDGRGGASHRRDVIVVAGLPLPERTLAPGLRSPAELLGQAGLVGPGQTLAGRLGSARLQLGWPWLATDASAGAPEGVEAPDGMLTGTLAAAALAGGAHRSIGGRDATGVRRLLPELARAELGRATPQARWAGDRLCLVARGTGAEPFAFISDATLAGAPAWRAGGVSRLTGVLIRAARTLGQELAFESSGPRLWSRARSAIEALLRDLWSLGALAGATPLEAYQVACDGSTMTQADIDAGRLIVTVGFTAAQPVEHVTVTLDMGVAPAIEAAA